MNFWDDEPSNDQYAKKEKLPVGVHKVKLAFVKYDDTGDSPKLSLKYENEKGEAWQNFTFKESSLKLLTWQMGILGVRDYIKSIVATKKQIPSLKEGSLLAFNFLDKNEIYLEIEVTERDYQGKKLLNTIIFKRIDKEDFLKSSKTDVLSDSTDDLDELPF